MNRENRPFITFIILLALLLNGRVALAQEISSQVKKEVTLETDFQFEHNFFSASTFKIFESKYFGKIVKGAPYSATAITEFVQTLGDGNQIIRKNETKVYRDSEGRTRREQKLETIGKWTAAGDAPQMIAINDPVAGFTYSLDPRARTARKGTVAFKYQSDREQRIKDDEKRVKEIEKQEKERARRFEDESKTRERIMTERAKAREEMLEKRAKEHEKQEREREKKYEELRKEHEKRYEEMSKERVKQYEERKQELDKHYQEQIKEHERQFKERQEEMKAREQQLKERKERMKELEKSDKKIDEQIKLKDRPLKKEISAVDEKKKIEALGKKIIEGVEAEGKRSTRIIPAGEIGNRLPIEIVDENWYAADLQVQVMTKHSDPRAGVTTYRLTNISRSEPARALFELPSDYTVINDADLRKRVTKPLAPSKPATPESSSEPAHKPEPPKKPEPSKKPEPKMPERVL